LNAHPALRTWSGPTDWLLISRVVRYRAEHGLSQSAFGRLVGMRKPHVARLESGDHEPSLSTLARLSAALGIDFTLTVTPSGVELREARETATG
jgi:transcriptional regulator with XRE-family HTH domain